MRKFLVLLTSFAVMTVLGGIAAGSSDGHVVKIVGHGIFKRNALVAETLRFQPGAIWVQSGARVRWVKADDNSDPHTITIVNRSDRPNTFDEVFGCGQDPTDVCSTAGAAHFPNGFGQPPVVVRVDPDSTKGLDRPGDSLFLCPNFDPQQGCSHGSISEVVSAHAGTTLYYICIIHPWMQGTIHVV